MRISPWRLGLTGGAIVLLAGAGIGLVNAGSNPPTAASAAEDQALDAALEAAAAPAARDADGQRGDRQAGPVGRWVARHLVHAVVTIQGEDGDLYTIQLDRGTVSAIDADNLTLKAANGSSVTVALNADTRVREGRKRSSLEAVTAGADVFVQSRVTEDGTLAKRIFIVPAG